MAQRYKKQQGTFGLRRSKSYSTLVHDLKRHETYLEIILPPLEYEKVLPPRISSYTNPYVTYPRTDPRQHGSPLKDVHHQREYSDDSWSAPGPENDRRRREELEAQQLKEKEEKLRSMEV